LVRLADEVFGVVISEGAIANLLARAEPPMTVEAQRAYDWVRFHNLPHNGRAGGD
jgi:hypothetical protein